VKEMSSSLDESAVLIYPFETENVSLLQEYVCNKLHNTLVKIQLNLEISDSIFL
jgi:hypothetical protein